MVNSKLGFPPPMVRLCGLWKSIDKNGKEFWTGNLGNSRLFIFPNDNKKDGSPDYDLCLGQRVDRREKE
ncbi:MAG: hypothetical protein MUO31_00805 [Thermodesulfovibrionales bacterium]|nr:hypothetical protein [Thermodesulfovibrionales bacterium]